MSVFKIRAVKYLQAGGSGTGAPGGRRATAVPVVLALALLSLGSGCVEVSALLKVNENGTGKILLKSFSRPGSADSILLEMLSQTLGEDAPVDHLHKGVFSLRQLRRLAARMGNGVTLESVQRITRADGANGTIATYAFRDIRSVRIGPSVATLHLEELGLVPMDWSYSFVYFRKQPNSLFIYPPLHRQDPDAVPIKDLLRGVDQVPGFNRFATRLLQEVRFKLLVETEGPITASTASFPSSRRNNLVTLVDVPLRPIMEHAGVEALLNIKDLQDIQRLQKMQIPGVLLEDPLKRIAIEFQ